MDVKTVNPFDVNPYAYDILMNVLSKIQTFNFDLECQEFDDCCENQEYDNQKNIINENIEENKEIEQTNNCMEEWEKLSYKGCIDYYISSFGEVRSLTGKILKKKIYNIAGKDKVTVCITSENKRGCRHVPIDKLVMDAFTNYQSNDIVHKDADIMNNRLDNLEFN